MRGIELCCVAQLSGVVAIIGGKWKIDVVYCLLTGTKRFGELRRSLPAITQRVLTLELRQLQQDGIVVRTMYPTIPPKVEYSLTERGRMLQPVFAVMETWAGKYRGNRKRESYAVALHANCGNGPLLQVLNLGPFVTGHGVRIERLGWLDLTVHAVPCRKDPTVRHGFQVESILLIDSFVQYLDCGIAKPLSRRILSF